MPRGWVLRSSLDGFASDIASADIPTIQPTLTSFDVDLASLLYHDIQSEVTFRLYGYAPSAGVGSFYDNLMVTGVAEQIVIGAVPEPPSLFLVVIGLAGILRFRRCRKQAGERNRHKSRTRASTAGIPAGGGSVSMGAAPRVHWSSLARTSG